MGKRKQVDSESEGDQYRTSKFVDVEASEEENEEEEESSLSSFINEIEEQEELPQEEEEEEEEFEEYTKQLEERYTEQKQLAEEEVPQQMLLPSDRDPRLWLVRCLPKREKHIALALMKKALSSETDSPISITGVLFNDSIPGYVYVEAYQKQQVLLAIEGISGAFKTAVTQVPSKEMADALFVSEADPIAYKEGNLLWLTKGKYSGDLVQVEGISSSNTVIVKIVPKSGNPLKRALFTPETLHPSEVYKVSKNNYIYRREKYKDGFLIKEVPSSHLTPSPAPSHEDRIWFSHGAAKRQLPLGKGEFVEISHGPLKGASGVVLSISGEDASVKIGERKLTVPLEELKKQYAVGDEVIILSGKKRGKSGFILSISGERVKVGIDSFTEEVDLYANDIKLGSIPQQHSSPQSTSLKQRKDPLLNKQGTITGGPHKGKRGIVKDVQQETLRIELSTNLRHVVIRKEEFSITHPVTHNTRPHHVTHHVTRSASREDGGSTPPHEDGGSTPVAQDTAQDAARDTENGYGFRF
ncbi:transcription elongation factor SPT5 [Nematocida sp. LUAm3]|nr:transcription elongation factor SPT5 [Nematocida sp. LUAm3]KAI5175217.1 transcription elongation factor SPT5 [Nematocida sp. LUAm2]KAI5178111.1 transcription elongation factor SPT5 [Nematocida sp. LUAm1]